MGGGELGWVVVGQAQWMVEAKARTGGGSTRGVRSRTREASEGIRSEGIGFVSTSNCQSGAERLGRKKSNRLPCTRSMGQSLQAKELPLWNLRANLEDQRAWSLAVFAS